MAIKFHCMRFCALVLLVCSTGVAQPVAHGKQEISGLELFGDFRNDNLFYYAPGKLKLALDPDGKPKFQLLEMRYTGTAATGDSGEKRFMNVVQFTVSMDQVSAEMLKEARLSLGSERIELRPLPMRSIEAILVTPVGDPNAASPYTRIGTDGSFQAAGNAGTSGRDGYWTERTFTLKLENHEAQLLWDQVEQGQLALSLGYAFYADIIPARKGDMEVTGDKPFTEEMESQEADMLTTDTLAVTQMVKADAFPVRIDAQKWPDLLKKIDINEGVPPAYAALEVRCYDFTDDLRPDLAIKAVEIQATGVSGRPVTLPAKKFSSSQPDLNAQPIHFPYAVKLTQPFRYRVIEYTLEGNREEAPWITKDSWASVLDITTPLEKRKFLNRHAEVEVPSLTELHVEAVDVQFYYTYRGQSHEQSMRFGAGDELPVQRVNIRCDKDTDLYYEAIWHLQNGESLQTERNLEQSVDGYMYLPFPGKK
jgi:hypothetical protein